MDGLVVHLKGSVPVLKELVRQLFVLFIISNTIRYNHNVISTNI